MNEVQVRDGIAQLDIEGVRSWLLAGLRELSVETSLEAVIPVAHGAAGVLLDRDKVVAAIDYETSIPTDLASQYDAERDDFTATLSPRLPGGLNLGVQLFWLESLFPDLWPGRGQVYLWPQYWAWFLCGEAACEVTSLGCHSDLYRPLERRFSDLATRRGWASRLGPLRRADQPLGVIRASIAAETGLSPRCRIYCGLHDSNAALHAARGLTELQGRPFSVVSTGTWFVCLNADSEAQVRYDSSQDMLANVDVEGRPVPTSRFMGGRDYETWMGDALGAKSEASLLGQARGTVAPSGSDPKLRATQASLELARRTDHALALIAAEGPILIEGRFAEDQAFGLALAHLRPSQPVYRSRMADGVAAGALRLVSGRLFSPPVLECLGADN
jgi:sugar (pentulose or hexulose) kinase